MGIGGLAALTGFVWLGGAEQVAGWLEVLLQRLARLRWVLVLVMPVLLVGFPVLMFGRLQAYFSQDWTRHAIFAWLVVYRGLLAQILVGSRAVLRVFFGGRLPLGDLFAACHQLPIFLVVF